MHVRLFLCHSVEMLEASMSRIWLRRYKLVLSIAVLLLSVQLFLAYLLPILGTVGDIGDVSHSGSLYDHLLDERKKLRNKAVFNELFGGESPSIDDEDIINSNSILNFKDAVVLSKTSSSSSSTSTKDHSDGTIEGQKTSVGDASNRPHGNHASMHLNDLNFKPNCDIVAKEAISAINRAQTKQCKEIIANISCAIQNQQFYPDELPNECPHEPYQAYRSLGCFKDDKKFRTLSGYYINFKTTNAPKKCIQLCLQSGFVYAGVQYSYVSFTSICFVRLKWNFCIFCDRITANGTFSFLFCTARNVFAATPYPKKAQNYRIRSAITSALATRSRHVVATSQ